MFPVAGVVMHRGVVPAGAAGGSLGKLTQAYGNRLGVLFTACLEMFGEQFDPLVEGFALATPGYVLCDGGLVDAQQFASLGLWCEVSPHMRHCCV